MSNVQSKFGPAFLDGALETMQKFFGIVPDVITVKSKKDFEEHIAIAGLIGITAKDFEGSMFIGFSEPCYLDLMEKMIGEKYETLTREIQDGAAEFANIIFGQAKVPLNEMGFEIRMALPSVIRGTELGSVLNSGNHTTRYLMKLPKGVALLEISGRSISATTSASPVTSGDSIPSLDAKTLMSFVDAVRQTMQIQCGVEIDPGVPFRRTDDTAYEFDIGALIGVNGRAFRGTLAIAFEEKVYRKIYFYMTKEKHATITDEMGDGASEITNIIFGIAKAKLNEQGHGLQMALPTMIVGPKMEFKFESKKPSIALPFNVGAGKMWVEFAFDDLSEAP